MPLVRIGWRMKLPDEMSTCISGYSKQLYMWTTCILFKISLSMLFPIFNSLKFFQSLKSFSCISKCKMLMYDHFQFIWTPMLSSIPNSSQKFATALLDLLQLLFAFACSIYLHKSENRFSYVQLIHLKVCHNSLVTIRYSLLTRI